MLKETLKDKSQLKLNQELVALKLFLRSELQIFFINLFNLKPFIL